jgi:DNA end-binding protein Ku
MPKPKTVPNKLLIGFSDEQLAELDNWRRRQEDLPSRSEGVRRLVDGGVAQMDARENWKGFLRLSLVTCPVELIPAAEVTAGVEATRDGHDERGPRNDTISIEGFVPRSEVDPRYVIRPYYLVPDGKVGHDAFAVIRETIRTMDKVAIGRAVLNNRERQIALYPHDKGMVGMLLRYADEVRNPARDFSNIQDIKVSKDMLELAMHIVEQMSTSFEPDRFKNAPTEPREQKQKGWPHASAGANVISLGEALRKMIASGKAKQGPVTARKQTGKMR